jgi:hypothetical protein
MNPLTHVIKASGIQVSNAVSSYFVLPTLLFFVVSGPSLLISFGLSAIISRFQFVITPREGRCAAANSVSSPL